MVQDRTRAGGQGINSVERDHADAYRAMLDKHGHEWTDRRSLSQQLYFIGRNQALYASQSEARPYLARAVKADPTNLKAWAALALSRVGLLRQVTLGWRALRGKQS